jgi:hypothetical protein
MSLLGTAKIPHKFRLVTKLEAINIVSWRLEQEANNGTPDKAVLSRENIAASVTCSSRVECNVAQRLENLPEI